MGHDWNGNGKQDAADSYIDFQLSSSEGSDFSNDDESCETSSYRAVPSARSKGHLEENEESKSSKALEWGCSANGCGFIMAMVLVVVVLFVSADNLSYELPVIAAAIGWFIGKLFWSMC